MATARKRKKRGTGRRRRKAPLNVRDSYSHLPKSNSEQVEHSWFWQMVSIVFLTFGLFVGFSIILQALSLNYYDYPDRTKILGPIGSFVGTLLIGFFGWSSLLLAIFLVYLAFKSWKGELFDSPSEQPVWVQILGAVVFMIGASLVGFGLNGLSFGGEVGQYLWMLIAGSFGRGGAWLFSVGILLLSGGWLAGVSIGELIYILLNWIVKGVAYITLRMPVLVFKGAQSALYGIRSLVGMLAILGRRIIGRFYPLASPIDRPKVVKYSDGEAELGDADYERDPDLDMRAYVKRQTPKRIKASKFARSLSSRSRGNTCYFEGIYRPPKLSLLSPGKNEHGEDDETLLKKSKLIENKLRDFNIYGRVTKVHPGPVITLFEFEPAAGVKVGRISALADDLAMTLRAVSVRIIAPIPGKGTVGIEVPNQKRELVRLRDVLESPEFAESESILTVALGKDTYGQAVVADIGCMPHLLIAGATGTGKSVCINAMLLSLLYRTTPAELGLILIDPKILELSVYEGIPHLRVPVITQPKHAKAVLQWAVNEMNRRYRLMQKVGVRGIDGYNQLARGEVELEDESVELLDDVIADEGDAKMLPSDSSVVEDSEEADAGDELYDESLEPLPKIVIVIDELADLMLSVGKDIEDLITRLAQKARAAGIHLIVATQRPSVDVITGLIKANFPARLSFQVSSRVDSRTIIDSIGAEKLLGRGDMLFLPPGAGFLRRLHGAFVSDDEVKRVVQYIKEKCEPIYDEKILEICKKAEEEDDDEKAESDKEYYDALYDEAVELVIKKGKASTSMIQRALRIGYNRAARIIDIMEREGVVGPADGAKPREVLIDNRE